MNKVAGHAAPITERMGAQDPAVDRVVGALLAEGLIAPADERRARAVVGAGLGGAGLGGAGLGGAGSATEPTPAASGAGLPKLVEVVAYLGAALVLAAGFLFLMETWRDLGDTGQVIALAVVTGVLATAGLVVRGAGVEQNAIRRRLAGTLLTGSAVAAGITVGRALDAARDFPSPEVYLPAVVGGLVASAVSLGAYAAARTAVGQLGILGGLLVAAVTVTTNQSGDEALWAGGTFAVIGLGWLVVTELDSFAETTIARTLGVAATLFGSQVVAAGSEHHWIGYLMTALVCAGGIAGYLIRQDWPYLAAAVVAVTLVVPEAVADWTEGSLGVVGGVLLAGVTLLLASFAGYRLRSETR